MGRFATQTMLGTATLLVCTTVIAVSAQPDASSELSAFQEAWNSAKGYSPPPNVLIRWHESLYPDPTISEADLAAMAQRVEGRPDHPERAVLETERRRRRAGPDKVTTTVWYGGPGFMRINRDESWRDLYVDIALSDKAHWSMVPTNLTVMSPDSPAPDRDYTAFDGDIRRLLRRTVWSDFGSGLQPKSVDVTGDRWSAVAGDDALSFIRWDGVLSEDAGRALPDRAVTVRTAPRFANEVGRQTEYRGWHFDPVLAQWVVTELVDKGPEGDILRTLRLDAVETIDRSLLDNVTSVPSVTDTDYVRGVPTMTTIMDYRPHAERITTITAQGVSETPMSAARLGHPPSKSLRRIGWGVAGLIIAALVAIRLVRMRGTGTVG